MEEGWRSWHMLIAVQRLILIYPERQRGSSALHLSEKTRVCKAMMGQKGGGSRRLGEKWRIRQDMGTWVGGKEMEETNALYALALYLMILIGDGSDHSAKITSMLLLLLSPPTHSPTPSAQLQTKTWSEIKTAPSVVFLLQTYVQKLLQLFQSQTIHTLLCLRAN